MDDRFYMGLALEQARKGLVKDEVPVGAVLLDAQGHVIGKGHNRPISANDPTSHAEINAIRMAGQALGNYRLGKTCLYVTIEPCIMCMGAIIHARISRLVFGARDPKWGGAGSLYDMADDPRLNHRIEVVSGVCEDESKEIIKGFFADKRSR